VAGARAEIYIDKNTPRELKSQFFKQIFLQLGYIILAEIDTWFSAQGAGSVAARAD